MASKKKTIETPSGKTAAGSSIARQFLYQPRVLFCFALLVASAICFPLWKALLPDLSRRPEYRVLAEDIQITQPPRWVPRDLVDQVIQQANLPQELSLLDDNLTFEVAEAFRLHPWVDEVVSVTKSVPGQVQVKLNFRRPVAMVQVKQGMYPVDPEGVLLPPTDFSVSDTRLYPLILNVHSTPQGPAGTNWGDPEVTSAAQLADELSPHWKKLQLASIVCPHSTGNDAINTSLYVLMSTGGSRILWGRAPGTDHPGELTTEQKIGRLKKYAADFGGFDRPHGPYEIDIRHWQEISRRPLRAAAAFDDEDDVLLR